MRFPRGWLTAGGYGLFACSCGSTASGERRHGLKREPNEGDALARFIERRAEGWSRWARGTAKLAQVASGRQPSDLDRRAAPRLILSIERVSAIFGLASSVLMVYPHVARWGTPSSLGRITCSSNNAENVSRSAVPDKSGQGFT